MVFFTDPPPPPNCFAHGGLDAFMTGLLAIPSAGNADGVQLLRGAVSSMLASDSSNLWTFVAAKDTGVCQRKKNVKSRGNPGYLTSHARLSPTYMVLDRSRRGPAGHGFSSPLGVDIGKANYVFAEGCSPTRS